MEFISAEEFLKQPKEVQKVFINWWQPKLFDLIHIDYYSVNSIDTVISEKDIKKYGIEFFPNGIDGDVIPLFTEGQLRKFIEDKTGCKIDTIYDFEEEGYEIRFYETEFYREITGIYDENTKEDNLLQAYWKVVCDIAKEQIQ